MLNLHLLAHIIARRRTIYSIEHWFVAFHWSLVLYNNRCVKLLIILSEVIMFGRLHGMEWFLCDFSDTSRSVEFQRHHQLLTRLTLPFICTLSVFLEYGFWILFLPIISRIHVCPAQYFELQSRLPHDSYQHLNEDCLVFSYIISHEYWNLLNLPRLSLHYSIDMEEINIFVIRTKASSFAEKCIMV